MRFIPFNRMTDAEQVDHLREMHGVLIPPGARVTREMRESGHQALHAVGVPHTHDKPTLRRDAARLRAQVQPDTIPEAATLANLAADLLEAHDLTHWPAAQDFVRYVEQRSGL